MTKRALTGLTIAGLVISGGFALLVLFSLRAGVAEVTIPICMLVLGPALAATAMVATCSMVAPPRVEQRRSPIDALSGGGFAREEAVESLS